MKWILRTGKGIYVWDLTYTHVGQCPLIWKSTIWRVSMKTYMSFTCMRHAYPIALRSIPAGSAPFMTFPGAHFYTCVHTHGHTNTHMHAHTHTQTCLITLEFTTRQPLPSYPQFPVAEPHRFFYIWPFSHWADALMKSDFQWIQMHVMQEQAGGATPCSSSNQIKSNQTLFL